MSDTIFHDAHCHALTIAHPGFLSFLGMLRKRSLETIYSQVAAPGYLVPALLSNAGERLRNIFSVMENEVGAIFTLMEDDLSGLYAKDGDPPPLLAGGELAVGERRYTRLLLVPLVMDFGAPRGEGMRGDRIDAYYDRPPTKRAAVQARDLLQGIADYRAARPAGFLDFRPFIGLDPANHRLESLGGLLAEGFGGFRRGQAPAAFSGVKVYPPLGFDPWPEEGEGREKAEFLFGFCEERGIPVTTHCDDQGFRAIPLEAAWSRSSPARWARVLARFPRLVLDFAHFGMRYTNAIGMADPGDWTAEIVALMREYPGVHADLAFNGADPDYWRRLRELVEGLEPALRERVLDRILFGSDFPVCLAKTRSYADYLGGFSRAGLPAEWKHRFGSVNPARFLDGDCFA